MTTQFDENVCVCACVRVCLFSAVCSRCNYKTMIKDSTCGFRSLINFLLPLLPLLLLLSPGCVHSTCSAVIRFNLMERSCTIHSFMISANTKQINDTPFVQVEIKKRRCIRGSSNEIEREHCLFYFDYIYESFGEDAWEDTIVPMSRKHITTVFFT